MKHITDMTPSELFTEMTDGQRKDIFEMVLSDIIKDDVELYIHEYYVEDEFTEEEIEQLEEAIANDFVYYGEFDCHLSYWDNIDNGIRNHS